MGGGDEVSGETHYLSLVSVVSETPTVKSRSQQGEEGGVRTSMDLDSGRAIDRKTCVRAIDHLLEGDSEDGEHITCR